VELAIPVPSEPQVVIWARWVELDDAVVIEVVDEEFPAGSRATMMRPPPSPPPMVPIALPELPYRKRFE
jgi:hypothetical protein